MIQNTPGDRETPSLFLEQADESPDIDLRGHPNEESWGDPEQLLSPESQTAEDSSGEEADTDFENDLSGKANKPVVIYLQQLRSIPFLSRGEEVKLAQEIEECEAEIATEALSSFLALHWALDLGEKVTAGLVNMRDVVNGPREPSDLLTDDNNFKARFRTHIRSRVKPCSLKRVYEE